MLARDTYYAGTVKTNRKDLPKVVGGKHVKLKKKVKLYTIGMVTYYAYNGVTRDQLQCSVQYVKQLKLLLKESTMEK